MREHPDRLPVGVSDDARTAAVKRFREAHAAYERLLASLKRAGAAAGGGRESGGEDEWEGDGGEGDEGFED